MTEEDLPKKHAKTLDKIKHRPILGTIPWADIKKLFLFLGAEIEQREGSRVAIILNGTVHVFHEPHPERVTDKGAVSSVKSCLSQHFPDLFKNKK
ncbi:hypothetical protein AAFZ21_004218 [Vibrio fluvialis]